MSVSPITPGGSHFGASAPAAAAAGDASLLPAPAMGNGVDDAMAMIYVCLSKQNNESLRSGESSVASHKALRDEQLREERAAIQREKDAEGDGSKGFFASLGGLLGDAARDLEHLRLGDAASDVKDDARAAWNSPQFWRDVEVGARVAGEVAAAVGGACATVATFGAAAPALVVCAALVLSAAGTAESNFHVLEACGVDPNVAGYVGLGCSVGGAVAGGVGGLLASPGQASQLMSTVKTVGAVANGASGAADIVQGGAHVRTGGFEADAEDARADATEAQHRERSLTRIVEMVLDDMKEAADTHRKTVQALTGAVQTNDATMVATTGRMA